MEPTAPHPSVFPTAPGLAKVRGREGEGTREGGGPGEGKGEGEVGGWENSGGGGPGTRERARERKRNEGEGKRTREVRFGKYLAFLRLQEAMHVCCKARSMFVWIHTFMQRTQM